MLKNKTQLKFIRKSFFAILYGLMSAIGINVFLSHAHSYSIGVPGIAQLLQAIFTNFGRIFAYSAQKSRPYYEQHFECNSNRRDENGHFCADFKHYRCAQLGTCRYFPLRSGCVAVRRSNRDGQPHHLHAGRSCRTLVHLAALPQTRTHKRRRRMIRKTAVFKKKAAVFRYVLRL